MADGLLTGFAKKAVDLASDATDNLEESERRAFRRSHRWVTANGWSNLIVKFTGVRAEPIGSGAVCLFLL